MSARQHLSPAEPADLGLCPDRTQRLVDVLQAEVDRGYIPGAVVLLARHGQLALHQAIGQRNPGTGAAMTTADTMIAGTQVAAHRMLICSMFAGPRRR